MAKKYLTDQEKTKRSIPQDDCFAYIDRRIDEAITNTTIWSTNQEKWHKLRMRIKKTKTDPFPGCANIRMPTAEIKIRKLKASLFNIIFGIRPIIQAIPTPSGSLSVAQKIEKFLDHLVMDVMNFPRRAIVALDQM